MTFKMKEDAQTITVYNMKADTLEFIGSGDAYIPPHTGLPAYCTDIKPMKVPEGKKAVFNHATSTWGLIDDHRGEVVFDVTTGDKIKITELGPLPENTTSISPTGQHQKWNGEEWVRDEGAEILAREEMAIDQKRNLMRITNERISILQDAFELEIATDKEKRDLIELKKYRVMLNRVDCNKPEWPEQPIL